MEEITFVGGHLGPLAPNCGTKLQKKNALNQSNAFGLFRGVI